MDIKVIKDDAAYRHALAEVDRLLDLDPDDDTPEGDRLDLLSVLIEVYEARRFPIDLPDPINAIEFVMEQRGLKQKDLVPLIGSRSKVSEIMAGKRPLTRSMCQALHQELGIPAEIFLQDGSDVEHAPAIDFEKFPVKELVKRGYLAASEKADITDKVQDFFASVGGIEASPVLYRQTRRLRAANINEYSLEAWRACTLHRASRIKTPPFDPTVLNEDFLRGIARLSRAADGPLLARTHLCEIGIVLICEERHFARTYLDGAAFFSQTGNPVVALSLRHDRVDNFWFTLMHELVHVWKHLNSTTDMFVDDLDKSDDDPAEKEADFLAGEILVPNAAWENSEARHFGSAHEAINLANELNVHPAIIAGKIRHESNNYRKLNQLIGQGEIRKLFHVM